MVITILEAPIAPETAPQLQAAFNQAIQDLDAGITETFLVRDLKDPRVWRIMTIWESREALDAMRQSGETPRGVLMFRAAAAEPSLSVLEVLAHAERAP
jgi:heme-degrading monooxygenase HmoA